MGRTSKAGLLFVGVTFLGLVLPSPKRPSVFSTASAQNLPASPSGLMSTLGQKRTLRRKRADTKNGKIDRRLECRS
jgi:hypothetical protein